MDNSFLRRRLDRIKDVCSDRQSFKDYIQTEPFVEKDGSINTWRNEDLSPTPFEKQTWSWHSYVVFYYGVGFGNWTLGSSMIGIGLSWWQAILAIFISQMISSTAMYFNGRCAIVYKIGYPCVARSVFGMWGAYYFVGARAALAMIWMGVQVYSSAALLDSLFRAIFGTPWMNLRNTIPISQDITTSRMICFLIMWLVHTSLAHLRPFQLRKFFWVKSVMVTLAVWGSFIFCMIETSASSANLWTSSTGGASVGWVIMYGINTGMGNTATYVTNQPDMVRWANTRTAATWSQLVVNPLTVTLSATLGILGTAAINNAWNLDLWNQWDLMDAILDRYWSAGCRTGVALCSFCWLFYVLGINIAGNMLPFGSDATMLSPRYLTIVRGNYLVCVMAWAIVPWKIESSAAVFTKFLSGYGIFMGAVAAIMIVDYYLTRGNVNIASLYSLHPAIPHNRPDYYYRGGWNIQALIAYVCGVALPLPGFLGTLGVSVSETATHLGELGWLLSFIVAGVVYWGICKIWPTRVQRVWTESGITWEEMGEEGNVVEGVDISEEGIALYEDIAVKGDKVALGEENIGVVAC